MGNRAQQALSLRVLLAVDQGKRPGWSGRTDLVGLSSTSEAGSSLGNNHVL